MERFQS